MRSARDALAAVAAILAVIVLLAACGGPEPSVQPLSQAPSPAMQSPTPAPSPAATAGPTEATDTRDGFRLVLTLPATTVPASLPVAGEALLTTVDGRVASLAGSGSGLIGFTFEEIGGTRMMGGMMTSDCHPYTIAAGDEYRISLRPSAAWSEDDPNADFYRTFAGPPMSGSRPAHGGSARSPRSWARAAPSPGTTSWHRRSWSSRRSLIADPTYGVAFEGGRPFVVVRHDGWVPIRATLDYGSSGANP